jgi:hypothetical protein
MNPYPGACLAAGPLAMPDIIVDPPSPRCYFAVPGSGIQQYQLLDHDLFILSRARALR